MIVGVNNGKGHEVRISRSPESVNSFSSLSRSSCNPCWSGESGGNKSEGTFNDARPWSSFSSVHAFSIVSGVGIAGKDAMTRNTGN
jgi:hypothetical protein